MAFWRPNRREWLTGAAALVASPALGQVPASGEVEVAIVGAGAAGIAAARRIAAAHRSYALLEAQSRIGGRVRSGPGIFGIGHDRGAHRLSGSGRNPMVALARLEHLPLRHVTPFRRLQVGQREARDAEYDAFTAAVHRSGRAISAAGEAGLDIAATRALPRLGEWQETASFVLGPLTTSKDLSEVSTVDFARAEDHPDEFVCEGGLGRIVDAAVRGLAVARETPVTRINSLGRGPVALDTPHGTIRARAVIVTASTDVLVSGRIKFDQALPGVVADALAGLSLGTHDRLVFELNGNPFGFSDEQRILFKSSDRRNIALVGRVGGSDLAFGEFVGGFGREMSDAGAAAMQDFVGELLASHFGAEARKQMGRSEAALWSRESWVLGGRSAAAPGGGSNRRILSLPVHDRIFLAGEAVHESWGGTVAGAWVSGERAAAAALSLLEQPAPAAVPPRPRKSPRRRR